MKNNQIYENGIEIPDDKGNKVFNRVRIKCRKEDLKLLTDRYRTAVEEFSLDENKNYQWEISVIKSPALRSGSRLRLISEDGNKLYYQNVSYSYDNNLKKLRMIKLIKLLKRPNKNTLSGLYGFFTF
ncbi:hypothetical protein Bp8pS_161 [Bacillus phage vB_BpuM-BpSp]|nr:hypothetical protein Bp8pS_161 [Bacillus phage vB_BpuM-BpSp]